MFKFLSKIIILFFTLQSVYATTLQDFAYAIPIHVEKNKDLHQFFIPAAVYQHVMHANLADMRIFNANGNVVPFQIEQQELRENSLKQKIEFLPVYADTANISDVSLTLIKQTSSSRTNATNEELQGYLIPVEIFKDKVMHTVELQWEKDNHTWLLDVEIKQSDDLKHWTNASLQCATLVNLNYKDRVLLKNTLPVEKVNKKYVFVKWCGNVPKEFRIKNIYINFIEKSQDALQWMTLFPLAAVEKNTLKYDSKGYFPIAKLNLNFADQYGALTVRFFSKDRQQSKWSYIISGFFYHIGVQDKMITSNPVHISRNTNSLWRMEIAKKKRIKPPYPELMLGWLPAKIIFSAQEESSFILAFGSNSKEIETESVGLENFVKKTEMDSAFISQARLGQIYTLSGEKALIKKNDWLNSLLWFFLAIAVLFVFFVVYKIKSELRRR